jgi:hypothetical protein
MPINGRHGKREKKLNDLMIADDSNEQTTIIAAAVRRYEVVQRLTIQPRESLRHGSQINL